MGGKLSCFTHDIFFKDKSQTWCARAFENEFKGPWVVFKIIKNHCFESWLRYN